MALKQIPLKKRPVDIALVVFFIINFFFITYMIDVEQLVIADTNNFTYPVWPPKWLIDLVHWYGKNFDPVLMARPAWWRPSTGSARRRTIACVLLQQFHQIVGHVDTLACRMPSVRQPSITRKSGTRLAGQRGQLDLDAVDELIAHRC